MHPAWAWDNGGAGQADPTYGTHDWIAERALDWIPPDEKALIVTYRAAYLYGTEMPDKVFNDEACCHHVYFWPNGTVQDDASATRAMDMLNNALQAFTAGNLTDAAKWTGAMTHYVDDLASFGHVMGADTSWGPEAHHSAYESYVERRTDSPSASEIPWSFDGSLASISPFQAAIALAHDTTFDDSGAGHTAVWMDQHYNWSDPVFAAKAYQSINLAVNYVAEAVHDVWSSVAVTTTTTSLATSTTTSASVFPIVDHVVINEVEQNPLGDDSNHEWLVLYNPTEATVDITGWKIQTTHGRSRTYAIPAGTMLLPGGVWNITFPGQFVDNEDESLVLLNAQGQVIDSTPTLTDTADDSNTWQRSPDGSDNWVFVPEFPWPALLAFLILISTLVILRRQNLPFPL
jgi:hypothetical protein